MRTAEPPTQLTMGVALIALAASLAACGGSDPGDEGATATASSAASAPAGGATTSASAPVSPSKAAAKGGADDPETGWKGTGAEGSECNWLTQEQIKGVLGDIFSAPAPGKFRARDNDGEFAGAKTVSCRWALGEPMQYLNIQRTDFPDEAKAEAWQKEDPNSPVVAGLPDAITVQLPSGTGGVSRLLSVQTGTTVIDLAIKVETKPDTDVASVPDRTPMLVELYQLLPPVK